MISPLGGRFRARGLGCGGQNDRVTNPGLTLDRTSAVRVIWRRLNEYDQTKPQVADAVVAVPIAVSSTPWLVLHTQRELAAWICQVGLIVPLIWRRRRPMAVFAVLAVAALAQWFHADPLLADLALVVAVFTVALKCSRRYALAAGAVLEVGVILASVRWALGGSWIRSLVGLTGLLSAALLPGAVLRARRAHLAELTDRAARLELERDQQAQIAAVAERTRSARQMHDIIAHSLAVIVTLADGAAAKLATEPERAGAAVRSIADIGREVLGDTRRLLGILRTDPGNAARAPRPGLQQLDDLTQQLTSTGLHATRFEARLLYAYPSLTLEAVDDGAPTETTTTHPGSGIAGMRERVGLYGGTIRSGPEPDRGWRVTATLAAAHNVFIVSPVPQFE
jgi:signal transduction histidine kinase